MSETKQAVNGMPMTEQVGVKGLSCPVVIKWNIVHRQSVSICQFGKNCCSPQGVTIKARGLGETHL